jgi:hypothetical protein
LRRVLRGGRSTDAGARSPIRIVCSEYDWGSNDAAAD